MRIIGADLETTGLLHPDHRVIEVYLGEWDEHGNLHRELNTRIDPRRSIAADAQRVHGISSSMLVGCPTWEDVAKEIHDFLAGADVIVWHNGDGFDGPFLDQEFKRVGVPRIPAKIPRIDSMNFRWAMPLGEAPSLQNLCFACGVDYDLAKAHAADFDVKVMMECFFKAVKWGLVELPSPAPAAELVAAA